MGYGPSTRAADRRHLARTRALREGIWRALEVFERADVDQSKLALRSMRCVERSARSLGPVPTVGSSSTGSRASSLRDLTRRGHIVLLDC